MELFSFRRFNSQLISKPTLISLVIPVLSMTGITEVHKLENNENLRLTLDSMQMPKVEYKEINMDDYSMCQSQSHFNGQVHVYKLYDG